MRIAMKKPSVIPIVLLLAFWAGLCGSVEGVAYGAAPPGVDADRLGRQIHTLINQEREKTGLRPLAWDNALQRIARNHSRNMATERFFSHYDSEGRDFSDRYRQAGYTCAIPLGGRTTGLGGENIAQNNLYRGYVRRQGKTTYFWNTEAQLAAEVVRQWMGSSGHRRNILTGSFRREGIGVAIAKDGKVFITQNFC